MLKCRSVDSDVDPFFLCRNRLYSTDGGQATEINKITCNKVVDNGKQATVFFFCGVIEAYLDFGDVWS